MKKNNSISYWEDWSVRATPRVGISGLKPIIKRDSDLTDSQIRNIVNKTKSKFGWK